MGHSEGPHRFILGKIPGLQAGVCAQNTCGSDRKRVEKRAENVENQIKGEQASNACHLSGLTQVDLEQYHRSADFGEESCSAGYYHIALNQF